ncbi:MAG: hypothetical protein WC758_08495 [Candidatus Woesearchaeota archaeon]
MGNKLIPFIIGIVFLLLIINGNNKQITEENTIYGNNQVKKCPLGTIELNQLCYKEQDIINNNLTYKFNKYTEEELFNTCSSLSFLEKIKCIKDFSYLIYKYRFTNNSLEDPKISFEELKNNGGDCLDWSLFYKNIFDRMGLVSWISSVPTKPEEYILNGKIIIVEHHAFNWVRTNDGSNQYCVYIDIINPVCGTYIGDAEKDIDFPMKVISINSIESLNSLYNKLDMEVIK